MGFDNNQNQLYVLCYEGDRLKDKKVGVSGGGKNTVFDRIKELNSSNHGTLISIRIDFHKAWNLFDSNGKPLSAMKMEKEIHKLLTKRGRHLNGEWFSDEDGDLVSIVESVLKEKGLVTKEVVRKELPKKKKPSVKSKKVKEAPKPTKAQMELEHKFLENYYHCGDYTILLREAIKKIDEFDIIKDVLDHPEVLPYKKDFLADNKYYRPKISQYKKKLEAAVKRYFRLVKQGSNLGISDPYCQLEFIEKIKEEFSLCL